MAIPSGGLSDTLAQVALKRVLKKTLLDKILTLSKFDVPALVDFPLTASFSGKSPLVYRSAIALQQAKTSLVDVETLAQQWVEMFAERENNFLIVASGDSSATAEHWFVEVGAQGWISIILTDLGITTWLQTWNDRALSSLTLQDETASILSSENLPKLPLCVQLKLSLPMLLQFGHACCCYWLQQGRTLAKEKSVHQLAMEREQALPDSAWGWSSESPIACHMLLRAIVRALDTMAAQAGDRMTCLRQGYAIAEAVYRFQAAIPLVTIHSLPPESQVSIWSSIRAAQQSLALVILAILKQIPMQSF